MYILLAGNDRIEFPQFLIMMVKIISNAMEEIREVFRSVDTDGNGVISLNEMEQVITDLGDVMTEEDIQQLRDVDVDGDGNINYEGNLHIKKIMHRTYCILCFYLQNSLCVFRIHHIDDITLLRVPDYTVINRYSSAYTETIYSICTKTILL